MSAPDATRQELRYRLLDLDLVNPLLADNAALDAAISMATTKYSQDRPLAVVEDELGNGTPFLVLVGAGAVLASWSDGFSDILSIDYPAGAISATYEPTWLEPGEDWTAYRDASKTYLWLRSAAPTTSETVRITYSARHTHTSVLDTVPPADFDALCDLSAHVACVMLATKMAASSDSTMGADSTNYRDGQLRFKQQAEAWLATYSDRMGLAVDGTPAGASAVVDWDSKNIAVNRRWLTHGRGR